MSRYIYLNTRDRNEGSNGDAVFTVKAFDLPKQFVLNLTQVQVMNYFFPITLKRQNYNVYFQENDNSSVTFTASLTRDRFYTADQIRAELETQMNAVGSNTYSLTFDANTNKLSISSTPNNFRFVAGSADAQDELGYEQGATFSTSLTFTNPIDISGTKYFDIISNLYTRSTFNSTNQNNPLCRVAIDEPLGNLITHEPQLRLLLETTSELEKIEMRVKDDKGFDVDLPSNCFITYYLELISPVHSSMQQ